MAKFVISKKDTISAEAIEAAPAARSKKNQLFEELGDCMGSQFIADRLLFSKLPLCARFMSRYWAANINGLVGHIGN